MNQRDEIVSKIAKAGSLQEQARAVAELDAYDRMNREASAQARSLDWADTTVKNTLSPVAAFERSTEQTDWLDDISTVASNAAESVTVEASMWYRRVSPEVKADSEEFAEQARGMARRVASAHGANASALEAEFLQYVSFLHSREAASGLPQVQQVTDSFENKAPQPLPEQVFDNFAPPVAPINEGVSGMESSTRAPLIDAAMAEAGSPAGVETHHDTAPQPYTYAEVPPGGPQDASAGSEPPLYQEEGLKPEASLFTPTVGISHTATLEDFTNGTGIFAEAASGLDQVQQVVDSFEEPDEKSLPTDVAFPWIISPDAGGQANQMTGPMEPSVNPSVVNRQMNTSEGQERMAAFQRRAAYVAHLLAQDPNALTDAQRTEVQQFTALLQKRAASFPGGVSKQADAWSQSGPQWPMGPGNTPANSPATTPDPLSGSESAGRAEGRSDWPNEANDYNDDSPSIPGFARGHAEGYQEAAQANPTAGAAAPGQMPPGAGGINSYQTHSGSLQAEAIYTDSYGEVSRPQLAAYRKHNVSPSDHEDMRDVFGDDDKAIVNHVKQHSPNGYYNPPWGWQHKMGSKTANQYIKKDGDSWVITQKGTGKVLSHHASEEEAQKSFEAMEAHKHGSATAEMVRDADHAVLDTAWNKAFADLKAAGLEHDADHPIAKAYRDASDAVNHANRSRDFAIATGQSTASLKVSASFTSPMDAADPEFKKAYKYATKWTPGTRLVRQGSAAFEAGLYAGISDNPAAQSAWVQAHERTAKKHGESFTKRIAMHREFSKQAARNTGLKVEGAYLKTADRFFVKPNTPEGMNPEEWDSGYRDARHHAEVGGTPLWRDELSGENGYWGKSHDDYKEGYQSGWDDHHRYNTTASKTAGTEMDLDTMAPTTSPSPTGDTPINGPGQPGPLSGDGQNPVRPGGPSPYQGAPPYGHPAVPNGQVNHGTPQAISDIPGAPVDKAAAEHLSPQTAAFRKRVQANLLMAKQASPKARTAAGKKVPVCNGCGETFESREVANEVHGKNGCGSRDDQNTGYKMTPEDEAW